MSFEEFKKKCSIIISQLETKLSKLRAGRATSALVESIEVQAYGSKSPLMHLATITVLDARTIVINPWDKSLLEPILVAIQTSDLGVNPVLDAGSIKITIPLLSEERRKELVKIVKSFGEQAKVAIRQIRREVNEDLESLKKQQKWPDDYFNKLKSDLENLVKKFINDIDGIVNNKCDEVMKV